MWEGGADAYAEARSFCDLWGVDGTVLVDEGAQLAEALGIKGVPTNVLVDEDGTITCVGATTPAALETAVARLLGPDRHIPPPGAAPDWHWQQSATHIEDEIGRRSQGSGSDT